MAFTARACTDGDIELLRALHGKMYAPTHYDGNYVAWDELPDAPDNGRRGLYIVSGEPRADENAELSPSTWAEFARYAIVVRGPRSARLASACGRTACASGTSAT